MKLNFVSFLLLIFFLVGKILPQGFICAVGGGSENYNDWSDVPYSWIVQKAANKKIIILSYSSDVTSWLPNYFISKGAITAYNKTISSRTTADLQSTYDELITADGIFLRGGDQWQYINIWKGTKTEQALKDIFQRGGVIAGTSAGAMVLGQFNFTARYGSATSYDALNNPLSNLIDIDSSFLPLIPDVLFDTHFIERGRFGRAIASIFKSKVNWNRDFIAVGIDDKTAICIDSLGIGTVVGSGAAAIFFSDEQTRYEGIFPSYTVENLLCHQLTANWQFDFNSKTISYIPPTAKEFSTSIDFQFPSTDFILTGNNNLSIQINNNLQKYLTTYSPSNILVLSHQGFVSSVQPVINYLNNNSITNNLLFINDQMLNDNAAIQQIQNANGIIVCGDSLSVLSKGFKSGSEVAQAIKNKVEIDNTPFLFFGNAGKLCGDIFVDNVDTDALAGYRGKMIIDIGGGAFGDFVFQPRVFENSDYFENRVSALLWGMMRGRKKLGLYLNQIDVVNVNHSYKTISGSGTIPFIIIDASNTTKIDSSIYRASSSVGTRQLVAMNNLRYSISRNNDMAYSIVNKTFVQVSTAKENKEVPTEFILFQNYPNPFNPITTIKFTIPNINTRRHNYSKQVHTSQLVSIKIYNILGKEVVTLINEEKSPGTYEINWNASSNSSGIYICKLQAGEYVQIKKLVLLK